VLFSLSLPNPETPPTDAPPLRPSGVGYKRKRPPTGAALRGRAIILFFAVPVNHRESRSLVFVVEEHGVKPVRLSFDTPTCGVACRVWRYRFRRVCTAILMLAISTSSEAVAATWPRSSGTMELDCRFKQSAWTAGGLFGHRPRKARYRSRRRRWAF
jgi:hypothetical protein